MSTGRQPFLPAAPRAYLNTATDGLDSFYRGALADQMAAEMSALGLPLTAQDLRPIVPTAGYRFVCPAARATSSI
jgi:gamma-glutamyltranspeptidase